ncbi:hypothetical protein DFJ73DRAFT_535527 [Zopfochytrium polystomum]|nr:hypothetical protein DFJ73DRAFT_535527 [Zopfochytrium polystomum]
MSSPYSSGRSRRSCSSFCQPHMDVFHRRRGGPVDSGATLRRGCLLFLVKVGGAGLARGPGCRRPGPGVQSLARAATVPCGRQVARGSPGHDQLPAGRSPRVLGRPPSAVAARCAGARVRGVGGVHTIVLEYWDLGTIDDFIRGEQEQWPTAQCRFIVRLLAVTLTLVAAHFHPRPSSSRRPFSLPTECDLSFPQVSFTMIHQMRGSEARHDSRGLSWGEQWQRPPPHCTNLILPAYCQSSTCPSNRSLLL